MRTKMVYVEDLQPGMWLRGRQRNEGQGYAMVQGIYQPVAESYEVHTITEVRKFGSVVSVILLDPETDRESSLTLPEWEHVHTVLDPFDHIVPEQFMTREEPS